MGQGPASEIENQGCVEASGNPEPSVRPSGAIPGGLLGLPAAVPALQLRRSQDEAGVGTGGEEGGRRDPVPLMTMLAAASVLSCYLSKTNPNPVLCSAG